MDVFSLVAKLSIDTSEYDKKIQNAEKEFSAFSSTLKSSTTATSGVAKALSNIGTIFQNIKDHGETFRKKQEELVKAQQAAAQAAETNLNKLNVLKGLYADASSKVEKLTAEFNKAAKEEGSLATNTLKLAADLEEAESEASTLKSRLEDFAKAASSGGKSVSDLGNAMDSASRKTSIFADVLSANLVTNALGGLVRMCGSAISAIGNLVSSGIGALGSLAKSAVGSYASFQQLEGGIQTLFKDSANKVIEYSKQAYKTAGMSQNEYLETVISFASTLINSTKGTVEKLSAEQVKAQEKGLDQQYKALQKAQNKEYNLVKKGYDKQYKELQKFLNKEYDARRKELDKVYDALADALDDEIEAAQKENEKIVKAAEKAYDKQVDAYEKAVDKRIDLIDKEYEAAIGRIDAEKKRRIQAIDDQIDAIEALDKAEDKAARDQERTAQREALTRKLSEASSTYARRKAQEELKALNDKIAKEDAEDARKAQIEKLKDQKEAIKDEQDAKKDAAKESRDAAVNAIKEESKATLAAMKERHEQEMEELKDAQKAQIEAMRDSRQAQLEALKETQSEELEALKEGHNDQLEALRESQNEQLEVFKDGQQAKLEALKESIDAQKEVLNSGLGAISGGAADMEADFDRAAEVANMAIIDMSDNVNKMGTNMDMVKSAYTGFSRSNFTMLDNLALGYAGTKEGMEKLLKDAEKFSGVKYDISSYEDVVQAIHAIQQQMGISEITAEDAAEIYERTGKHVSEQLGTTAAEAEHTISGSINQLKASWQNALGAFANPNVSTEELEKLFDEVANSAITVFDNIEPALEAFIKTLPKFVERAAKFFNSDEFKTKVLPVLEKLMSTIFDTAAKVWDTVKTEVLPVVTEVGKELATAVWNGFKEAFKDDEDVTEAVEKVESVLQWFEDNKENISIAIERIGKALEFLGFIGTNDAFSNGIKTVKEGWKELTGEADDTGEAVEGAEKKFNAFGFLVKNSTAGSLLAIKDKFSELKTATDNTGTKLDGFGNNVKDSWEKLKTSAGTVWDAIKKSVTGDSDSAQKDGTTAWEKLKTNISTKAGSARDEVRSKFGDMKTNAIDAAKKLADGVGQNINNVPGVIKKKIGDAVQYLKDLPKKAWQWGADLMSEFKRGLDAFAGDPIGSIRNFAGDIASYIHFSSPDRGPLKDFPEYAPDMMKLFAQGVKDNTRVVTDQIEKSFDFSDVIADQTVNVTGQAGNDLLNGEAGYSAGDNTYNITINANNMNTEQDWNRVAEIISQKINAKANRRLVAAGAV